MPLSVSCVCHLLLTCPAFYVRSVDGTQGLIAYKAPALPNEPYAPPVSVLFIFFVWVWFLSSFTYYYCVYVVFRGSVWTYHSAHVEVKRKFHGVSSLLYLFIGFKD